MLKSKIHRAKLTGTELDYEGSIKQGAVFTNSGNITAMMEGDVIANGVTTAKASGYLEDAYGMNINHIKEGAEFVNNSEISATIDVYAKATASGTSTSANELAYAFADGAEGYGLFLGNDFKPGSEFDNNDTISASIVAQAMATAEDTAWAIAYGDDASAFGKISLFRSLFSRRSCPCCP